ncbi:Head closure protein Hc1 [Psychrobacter phage D'Alembert]|nr:Head closure protein Hc1 [Psychrobacter phage D'Alembert]
MSITTLGKRDYTVIRVNGTGQYIDGEYVNALPEEVTIRANIQPAMSSFRTQLLPEGDRNKEAITVYSNDWLYTARSATSSSDCISTSLPCDLVIYRGAKWEVVVSRPYGNFGEHTEALAIKLNESNIERIDGDIENII